MGALNKGSAFGSAKRTGGNLVDDVWAWATGKKAAKAGAAVGEALTSGALTKKKTGSKTVRPK